MSKKIKTNKLCEWCKIYPVKTKRELTCSKSCGAALRWFKMKQTGKLGNIIKAAEISKKRKYIQRLIQEFISLCKELDLEPSEKLKILFIRSRSRGYNNGFRAGARRRTDDKNTRISRSSREDEGSLYQKERGLC